jgi:hypothetical protein
MGRYNFKTTTIGAKQYELAKKLAEKDNRSIKAFVEVLIIREAQKEGIT